MRRGLPRTTAVIALALLAGCASLNTAGDRVDRDDYAEALLSEPAEAPTKPDPAPPPIPEMAPVVVAPEPPPLAGDRRVSVAVTEDVPLRDVFFQLAREAKVDLELDPGIAGGVIFIAHEQPFLTVVERLSELAGLRYEVTDGVLRVERDLPFLRSYRIDYPNLVRNGSTSIRSSTDISTAIATVAGTTGGGENASRALVDVATTADLWDEIRTNLQAILVNTGGAPRPRAEIDAAALEAADRQFTLNRQAGLLTVFADARQHRTIAEFLDRLHSSTSMQVLIEAKIVEVLLDDRFQSGIDWSAVAGAFGGAAELGTGFVANTAGFTELTVGTDDFDAAITVVQEFGTARTLSSPRVLALNNQQAILKVAENDVFFTVDVDLSVIGSTTTAQVVQSVDTEVNTVPIGLIMTVQPSIDRETGEITMNLRPTITRVVRRVRDPNPELAAADVVSEIPVVEVREVDTVVRMRSGEIMIMGGLMQEEVINDSERTPGFADVPLLGYLFQGRDDRARVTELVILLKATIVEGPVHAPQDRTIYETFTRDPRPLTF